MYPTSHFPPWSRGHEEKRRELGLSAPEMCERAGLRRNWWNNNARLYAEPKGWEKLEERIKAVLAQEEEEAT